MQYVLQKSVLLSGFVPVLELPAREIDSNPVKNVWDGIVREVF